MEYRSAIEGDLLHIVAEGAVSSPDGMLRHIDKIHARLVRSGLRKVLADETKCHIHVSLDGLKTAIRQVVEPPELETGMRRSAIVSSSMNYHLFRHTFDSVEGVEIFMDKDEARQWLAED